jgi:hypothetical protein
MASLKQIIKQKFDYDVADLGAYVDEQRNELLVRQVTEARTLQLIKTQEGIKGSEKLKLLSDTLTYQTADCEMTDLGETKFSDRQITVEPIGYKKGFCNDDLVVFWAQLALPAGAMAQNKELPFEALITNYILSLNALELDKLIWKGNKTTGSGNLAFMNGFASFLTVANGCTNLNPSNATAINAGNAYDLFYDMFNSMDSAVAESPEKVAFCGRENFNYLVKNLVDLNFFHYSPADIASMTSVIIPGTDLTVEKVPGLNGDSRVFVGKRSAFTFGTDLASDSSNFELWYSQDDDKLYIRSKFKAGVQVPFLNEIGVFVLD